MKLYFAPGACSIGIHILLEEIGKPYEPVKLDIRARRARQGAPFIALNPKAKVPTLQRDDGTILTEYPAIAHYLARPSRGRAAAGRPGGGDARRRRRWTTPSPPSTCRASPASFRPGNFSPNEADKDAVQARGREIFAKGSRCWTGSWAARTGSPGDVLASRTAAVFYVSSSGAPSAWASTLPPNLRRHFARMKARPAVQRMIAAEGLSI